MDAQLVNSQCTNFKTYLLYKSICVGLAQNVFKFRNFPDMISNKKVNETLLIDGAIAFFEDDIMGLLALPFLASKLDVNDEPLEIDVISNNGYIRHLTKGEFIIMYDNNTNDSIYNNVLQFAERLANYTRVSDINIDQQKTPRFFKVPAEKEVTFKNLINNVDGYTNQVIAYDDININDCTCVLEPAPFVADKIDTHKEKIYQEFLSYIGITSSTIEKKERVIKDELKASLGGNFAGRFNRFESRFDAVEKINEKFKHLLNNKKITVEYYDGIPSNKKEGEIDDSRNDVA